MGLAPISWAGSANGVSNASDKSLSNRNTRYVRGRGAQKSNTSRLSPRTRKLRSPNIETNESREDEVDENTQDMSTMKSPNPMREIVPIRQNTKGASVNRSTIRGVTKRAPRTGKRIPRPRIRAPPRQNIPSIPKTTRTASRTTKRRPIPRRNNNANNTNNGDNVNGLNITERSTKPVSVLDSPIDNEGVDLELPPGAMEEPKVDSLKRVEIVPLPRLPMMSPRRRSNRKNRF